MFNNVNEIDLGVLGGKKCTLISKNKYEQITNGNIVFWCMDRYENDIRKLLFKIGDIDRNSMIFECQKIVEYGVFCFVFKGDMIICGPYLDTSLSWWENDNLLIISDSALEIAKKTKASFSYGALSSYLLLGLPFYPFQTQSFWNDIVKINPFSILIINEKGIEEILLNKLPDVDQNIDSIITDIRHKLISNFCSAKKRYSSYSCDVSGGVDSACIVYAMKKITSELQIFHAESDVKNNSDTEWEEYISKDTGLKLNKLSSISVNGKRFSITETYINKNIPDSPLLWGDTEGYLEELINHIKEAPNHIHLIGIGGDELYTPMESTPWSIVHQEGIKSIIYALKYSFIMKRPFLSCLKDLFDKTNYKDEMKKTIKNAFKSKNIKSNRELSWSEEITFPKWMKYESKKYSEKWIKDVFDQYNIELDLDRSRFQALQSIIFQKNVFSQINQIAGKKVSWNVPFFNMEIINLSLKIPAKYSMDLKKTKPILYEILKGIVPLEVFTRGVKGDYSYALFDSYRTVAYDYREEIKNFELTKMGIIDAEMLSLELSMPTALQERIEYFMRVCILERWIRQVSKYIECK